LPEKFTVGMDGQVGEEDDSEDVNEAGDLKMLKLCEGEVQTVSLVGMQQ